MDRDLRRIRRAFYQEEVPLPRIAQMYIAYLERAILDDLVVESRFKDMGICEREISLELQEFLNEAAVPQEFEIIAKAPGAPSGGMDRVETWRYHIYHVNETKRRVLGHWEILEEALVEEFMSHLAGAKDEGFSLVAFLADDSPRHVSFIPPDQRAPRRRWMF